ncbi:tRNA 2-thiolation protein NcsA [Halorubrum sp. SY-15]|uniref:tRNA 2-thiolation protein NcsA n=1 Tax=Halorubrum sp. SY-15 TaxID=3402277 RepID=UPI003EBC5F75
MECDRCGADAIHHAAYSGAHLCGVHLRRSVETRVKRRVREDGLLDPEATPDDPDRWVVGLSGGKDSVVLTHILDEVFGRDPRVELLAVTVHEGIEGYRDESLDACLALTADRSIRHEVVSYEDEFGVRMDDVAETDPANMAPCAYCGVFRRDVLERYAESFDADKLLTGHNLDDEAQTALMNVLEGDVAQVAKHFDASLGPFDERERTDAFVPRAKPLRDVPEKEVALYCHVADLPAHTAECPHAAEAYRGEIRSLLHDLETNHPGTRHSIMAGYEELSALAADRYRGPVECGDTSTATEAATAVDAAPDDRSTGERSLRECERCGSTTSRPVCRTCRLLESIQAV